MFKDQVHKWYIATDYIHIIPEKPGCYAIYTYEFTNDCKVINRKLVYIGTAQNLQKRLRKHEVKKVLLALDKNVMIKCKIILNEQKRLNTEKQLINKLNPPINKI